MKLLIAASAALTTLAGFGVTVAHADIAPALDPIPCVAVICISPALCPEVKQDYTPGYNDLTACVPSPFAVANSCPNPIVPGVTVYLCLPPGSTTIGPVSGS